MAGKLLDFHKESIKHTSEPIQLNKLSNDDIAIIGIHAKLPMADDLATFWANLVNGTDCIREIPQSRREDIEQYTQHHPGDYENVRYSRLGYLEEIDKFDSEFFALSPKEAALMDPNQRIFLQTAWNAIEDAGYGGKRIIGSNTGVYVGFGGELKYGRLIDEFEPASKGISIPGNIIPIIPSRISYLLDLKGPSLVVDTACSSSLVAVHLACRSLRNGECDMALAGSVRVNLMPLAGSIALGIESSDGKTRAFDDSSDGSGIGEGAAAVLLKPLGKAVADRDHIYAVIRGSAINQDGSSIGITAPNPKAQEEVIVQAWKDAGVDPETITYIEAHGTGTKLGDPVEITGIERAFRRFTDRKQFCALSTVKTNIGHLENASGIAGLVKAVLALQHRQLPPSIHFKRPNRKIDFTRSPIYMNNMLMPWESAGGPRRCGVSSFGLSGTNCHMVLEEYEPGPQLKEDQIAQENKPRAFVLSAKNEQALKELISRYFALVMGKDSTLQLDDMCYTLGTGRDHYSCRLALLIHSREDLGRKLKLLVDHGWTELSGPEIMYNKHRLITGSKIARKPEDRTEAELRERTTDAAGAIHQFIAGKSLNASLLLKICRLYVDGGQVDWELLYRGQKRSKQPLPAYPFRSSRCWVHIPERLKKAADQPSFYAALWNKQPVQSVQDRKATGLTLIVAEDTLLSKELGGILEADGCEVLELHSVDGIGEIIRSAGSRINRIVHLTTLANQRNVSSMDELRVSQEAGVNHFRRLVKQLEQIRNTEPIEMILVAPLVHEITGSEELLCPQYATLFGYGKAAAVGNTAFKVRCIDTDDSLGPQALAEELKSSDKEFIVAYRNGQRYVERLDQLQLSTMHEEKPVIKENGVYLITGGTGRLGLEMAAYLSAQAKVRIILLNRTSFPDRSLWQELAKDPANETVSGKITAIKRIEYAGSTVDFIAADISSEIELEEALQQIRDNYKMINGIIHTAAVGVGDWEKGGLENRKKVTFEEEQVPKIYGTWLLDRLTRKDNLDFMLLFSSVMTLIGGYGAEGYTAANAYLDSFAFYRNRQGRKTLTVNWPTWANTTTGIQNIKEFESKQIYKIIRTEEAIDALHQVLPLSYSRVIIGVLNKESAVFELQDYLPFTLSEGIRRQKRTIRDRTAESGQSIAKEVRLCGRPDGIYTVGEIAVAQVWADMLGVEEMDLNDNFFEMGGNSIIAVRIINSLNQSLLLRAEITDLLKYPRFLDFAEFLDQRQPVETEKGIALTKVEARESYPVSPAQKRMLILHDLEKGIGYNNSIALTVEGPVDIAQIRRAFAMLVDRHEALRTFFERKGNDWVQKVAPQDSVQIELIYETHLEVSVEEWMHTFIQPFDLSRAPLIRAALIKVQENRHLLVYDMDHIISDGVTMSIVMKELASFCSGRKLPPLQLQYKDYAVWQSGLVTDNVLQNQEQFWLDQFQDGIAVLDLPLDYPRQRVQRFMGDKIRFQFGGEQLRDLAKLTTVTGSTLYMAMLAAFNVLLAKYTDQEDIIVGSPVSGRAHTDLENIIGLFVNTLVFRNHPAKELSFVQFLEQVKQQCLRAYDNQDLPFDRVVEIAGAKRDLSRNPLFDVALFYHNALQEEIRIDNLTFIPYEINTHLSKFDLTLSVIEHKDTLDFELEFNTDLFKASTIERMSLHLLQILQQCIDNPEITISDIELLTEEEKQFLLPEPLSVADCTESWNRLFARQVEQTPDEAAVICQGESLTYRELNARADRLACTLQKRGVGTESIVGIMAERSHLLITAIIAVLKAGGAYLPLDPNYPKERIEYILKDSKAAIILSDNRQFAEMTCNGEILYLHEEQNYDSDTAYALAEPEAENLAYVIYTSGSTGKPKGVMIEHRSLVNLIAGAAEPIDFSHGKTIVCLTTVSFDIFVLETLLPLTKGVKVILASEAEQKNPDKLGELLLHHHADMLQATPSLLQAFLGSPVMCEALGRMKEVMIGGENFPVALLNALKKICRGKIYNMYGPTETTVWSSINDLTASDQVCIGDPIQNTGIYVLNSCRQLQPAGIPGELYISGSGLARGYLHQADLTRERFVSDPFHKGQRMYRTGDLVKRLEDGSIEYLGRMDYQIKLRGYRIELEEIEAALKEMDGVADAVLMVKEGASDDSYLCAYIIKEKRITTMDIRLHLSNKLPVYMIPSHFIELEQLPLTPNGKVDKKALMAFWNNDNPVPDQDPWNPKSLLETRLAAIWAEVLEFDEPIAANHSFFMLGGNSVKAIWLQAKLEEELSLMLDIADIYLYPTIRDMAAYLESKRFGAHLSSECMEPSRPLPAHPAISADDTLQVPEVRKLEGIQPFNELFYKNCFYNSLFPAIQFYKKDILSFLLNDFSAYTLVDAGSSVMITSQLHELQPVDQVVRSCGIELRSKMYNADLLQSIIAAIHEGNPVIIWVDCYYESIRKQFYLKRHHPHSWLVYGYDKTNKQFHILEHLHADSLTYQEHSVSFNELLQCYEGYLNHCMKDMPVPTYYEFHPFDAAGYDDEQFLDTDYKRLYLEHYLQGRHAISGGLEALQDFGRYLEGIAEDEQEFRAFADQAQSYLNDIVNIKTVEVFMVNHAFSDDPGLIDSMECILQDWKQFRYLVLKSGYLSRFDPEKIQEARRHLKNITQNEHEFNKLMLKRTPNKS